MNCGKDILTCPTAEKSWAVSLLFQTCRRFLDDAETVLDVDDNYAPARLSKGLIKLCSKIVL